MATAPQQPRQFVLYLNTAPGAWASTGKYELRESGLRSSRYVSTANVSVVGWKKTSRVNEFWGFITTANRISDAVRWVRDANSRKNLCHLLTERTDAKLMVKFISYA